MIGCCSEPDPFGCRYPIHILPPFNSIFAPGPNVEALTFSKDCQAVLSERPSFLSLPDSESTYIAVLITFADAAEIVQKRLKNKNIKIGYRNLSILFNFF